MGAFMNRYGIGAMLASLLLSSFGFAEDAHWSYSGENGPAKWGDLPGYATCKTGQKQSPINITNPDPNQAMPQIGRYSTDAGFGSTNYPGPLLVHNNGHTIRVVFRGRSPGRSPGYFPPSWFTYNDVEYDLRELHFHAPGEHQFNGTPYPLEMHMVHQEWADVASGYNNGRRLVIAVLFNAGEANDALEKLLQNLPASGKYIPEPLDESGFGARGFIEQSISYLQLMPQVSGDAQFDKSSYRYSGSLTTPGCAEGITWIVLSTPVEASADQIRRLAAAMPRNNARPVQALNGRTISSP